MNMWAAKARGFAFGKTVIFDPDVDEPLLGTIDSGTTLIIIPTMIFENLVNVMAESFKDNEKLDFVCSRDKTTGLHDNCYFNNTKCDDLFRDHGHQISDIKF